MKKLSRMGKRTANGLLGIRMVRSLEKVLLRMGKKMVYGLTGMRMGRRSWK